MLRHADIWQAIDRLASEHGLSPSGLARRAGLDPTTFNKSKRLARDGRPRWPSTESLSKILDAVGASPVTFFAELNHTAAGPQRRLPVISLAQAAMPGFFDGEGRPSGTMWNEMTFPESPDAHLYAVTIGGESVAPLFRDGDTIVVSPGAPVRRGDRVLTRLVAGVVTIDQFIRRAAGKLELAALTDSGERSLATDEVAFVHRILWVSQ